MPSSCLKDNVSILPLTFPVLESVDAATLCSASLPHLSQNSLAGRVGAAGPAGGAPARGAAEGGGGMEGEGSERVV